MLDKDTTRLIQQCHQEYTRLKEEKRQLLEKIRTIDKEMREISPKMLSVKFDVPEGTIRNAAYRANYI